MDVLTNKCHHTGIHARCFSTYASEFRVSKILRDFKDRRTGLTAFRKNVISFPQEALELQDLKNFFSSVEINDIVNVYWQPAEDVPKTLHRARVFQIMQHGFRVQIEYHEKCTL